ncbi:MAG: Metalloendopeptidase-like protein membrane protein [Candidatus Nomurabacteria bacterium GW2011_GWC2_41_8]|uniref:Metalloendopeptidase-like protein membrane protein n=1 Tax=Candidatus Nomurabacteria bacterium GW2011_GWC2_41_8 TaxID=1618755 RepID=A0A0G0XIL7_9BACT|nr:MAG: Metalloendopeptidase-like protein membrane protein [Candidatus Nomurabacteria bacterium GW2011_GWC2_41_8]
MPTPAEAGFLSSIFGPGDQVYADTDTNTVKSPQPGSNLQNPELSLQAKVSPTSILQNKNSKDGVKDDTTDDTNANTDNISENALKSTDVFDGRDDIDSFCGETIVYVVERGVSISKVAKLLDVSESNVLAANNGKKNLVENDVLFIPSALGVKHTVTKGQTLQKIAKLYKVNVNDIAFCNDITLDTVLSIEAELTIPGGKRAEENTKPVIKSTTTAKNTKYCESLPVFAFVRSPSISTSGSIIGNEEIELRTEISGKVIFARMGYNGGFGGLVIIVHADGVKTMYGHMSKIIVRAGDSVARDDIIGLVGSTGRSTGPHVHFVVEGAFNSGINKSWAN